MWTKSQTTIALANVIRCVFVAVDVVVASTLFASAGCCVCALARVLLSYTRIYLPLRPTYSDVHTHAQTPKLASNQIFSRIFISDLGRFHFFCCFLVSFGVFCRWCYIFFLFAFPSPNLNLFQRFEYISSLVASSSACEETPRTFVCSTGAAKMLGICVCVYVCCAHTDNGITYVSQHKRTIILCISIFSDKPREKRT